MGLGEDVVEQDPLAENKDDLDNVQQPIRKPLFFRFLLLFFFGLRCDGFEIIGVDDLVNIVFAD